MTTQTTAIDHPTRRLVVPLPRPYEEAREHYETSVPETDLTRFYQMASWQATLELAEINAPHGFMRYYRSDVTAAMAGSPSFWKATQYLMGNHTIAERMFRHDPSVMLHAPLRTLLYADPDGDTKLAVDQPSLLFASYGNPQVAGVGRELDRLLAELITLLGGDATPATGSQPLVRNPRPLHMSVERVLGMASHSQEPPEIMPFGAERARWRGRRRRARCRHNRPTLPMGSSPRVGAGAGPGWCR